MSNASRRVAKTVTVLGILNVAEAWILHVFRSYAKAMLDRAGDNKEEVTRHVRKTDAEARRELASFLKREGLGDRMKEVILEEGSVFGAISTTVELKKPDLLVIGTRSQGALKRLLLGSVADEVLRRTPCDVLAVPTHS
jgi:nucleotide-binding universal stress UspA family protein